MRARLAAHINRLRSGHAIQRRSLFVALHNRYCRSHLVLRSNDAYMPDTIIMGSINSQALHEYRNI